MIKPGRYSAWFRTAVGEGAGVVDLGADGKLRGRDDTFAYQGTWTQEGERFRTTLSAKRVVAGPPGVFGMDDLDIIATGHSDGKSIACVGFARQSPGLKLEVMLTPDDS